MTSLRIKYGTIELHYDGDLVFEKTDIYDLVDKFSKLHPTSAAAPIHAALPSGQPANDNGGSGPLKAQSVSDIAQALNVQNGPDLVMAAAAAMHFIKSTETFEVRDLASSMREATAYSKPSYLSNLAATIKRLVKSDDLRSLGGTRYALSAKSIANLRTKLA